MVYRPRNASSTGIYHFYNRGINRENLFRHDQDFVRFKDLLYLYTVSFKVKLFHYCLMTNHIHFVLYAKSLELLAGFAYFVKRKYSHYYFKKYQSESKIFHGRYQSKPIEDESYLLECGRYVERNPIGAGMVNSAHEYKYSSYKFYALGEEDRLVTPSPGYLEMANSSKARQRLYTEYVNANRSHEKVLKYLPSLKL